MTIEIISTSSQKTTLGTRSTVEMRCGKHHATVTVRRGDVSYLTVCVHNAANRAWGGLGKNFDNVAAALAAYKTDSVRAMIEYASQYA